MQLPEKRKVLIIDDHPIVRDGLKQCLDQEDDLVVCGMLEDERSALQTIGETRPDLVIVDLALKDSSGINVLKEIKATFPDLYCLVLSMHDETIYAERSLQAGARGYVMKQESADILLQAIRKVLQGDIYLSGQMSDVVINRMAGNGKGKTGIDALSNRELEVFELIGNGVATRKISEKLNISVKTVETHRARIKDKLGIQNSTELVHYAVNWIKQDT